MQNHLLAGTFNSVLCVISNSVLFHATARSPDYSVGNIFADTLSKSIIIIDKNTDMYIA